jgi:hypothetical protein
MFARPDAVQNRSLYNSVQKKFPNAKIVPMQLIAYAQIVPGNNVLKFNLCEETAQKDILGTSRLLKKTSAASFNCIGLGLKKVAKVDGKLNSSSSPIVFHPDEHIFTGEKPTNGHYTEAELLEQIYNAGLEIKSDSTIDVERFMTNVFRTNANGEKQEMQLIDTSTEFVLLGNTKEVCTLTLSDDACLDSALIGGSDDHKNFVVLIMSGYEALEVIR